MESSELPKDRGLSEVEREAYLHKEVMGKDFVLKEVKPLVEKGDSNLTKLEFRHGETTETAHDRNRVEGSRKSVRDVIKKLNNVFSHTGINILSDTISIDTHGQLEFFKDINSYKDQTKLDVALFANTPEDLYKFAKEVQEVYPDYQFSFEVDPEGKWIKYTVTKTL